MVRTESNLKTGPYLDGNFVFKFSGRADQEIFDRCGRTQIRKSSPEFFRDISTEFSVCLGRILADMTKRLFCEAELQLD